ncbi:hypothetical protein M407DRAFT_178222 [Tulasnella calospora MUT 4182]|uniref:Lysine-specific metallo-endopeptidase domain-containing protein n=1 Tax=Tulasnella calospora MUT 4182 TaxID=1051891 RepID=A0A0C3QXN8_9AGAM|nr:hypothetical protein M407DRAFT_178222 [Tulasnella calospora MUT 4182]
MFARSSLLALCLAAASALAADLSVKVTGPTVVTSADNFTIKTVITNNGAEAVNLLDDPNSILTPKWKTNTFGIVGPNGIPAKFDGVKLKWSPASAIKNSHVTSIAPGESIELAHDVSGIYNLTESGAGVYTIDALTDFSVISHDGTVKTISASIQPHIARISGQLASFNPTSHQPTATRSKTMNKRAIGYSGCSSSQKSLISSAASGAQTYITNAISYLNAHTSSTPRFTTWFGSYTSSHHSTVLSHYSNLSGDPSSVTYDCSTCDAADTFAYTYPSDPTHIYLCDVFWNAPTTGTDSKAGTIVHELTHFTNNGGTQDYAYGQSSAKSLASSSSNKAVMNADNHEYFAENNPSLS